MSYDLLITAPSPTLILAAVQISISAPEPTITMTSQDEGNASVSMNVPSPSISIITAGSLYIEPEAPEMFILGGSEWNKLEIEAPEPVLLMKTLSTVGDLEIRAPPPELLITINDSTRASAALTAPLPTISITTHVVATATVALTAPSPVLEIETGGIVEDTALEVTSGVRDRKCVVLNTDNWEVTEYTWDFDQLIKHGDIYLAIDSTGIYTLGGDTFNKGLINSTIETGLDDFSIMASKRISNLCVGWKSSEDGLVSVIMDGDEDQTYEYDLIATNGKPDASRVDVGKPRQRKYINLKITNDGGADFDLHSIEMVLSTSIRKVQGM